MRMCESISSVDTERGNQGQNSAEFLADETRARQHHASIHRAQPAKARTSACDPCTTPRGWGSHVAGDGADGVRAPASFNGRGRTVRYCELRRHPTRADSALAVDAPEGTVKSQHGDWQVVCRSAFAGRHLDDAHPMSSSAAANGTTESTGNDLTIEQLAAQTGMSVRNIRAHQARGLLAPPEVRMRVGYYGPEHVAQLRQIRELQDRASTSTASSGCSGTSKGRRSGCCTSSGRWRRRAATRPSRRSPSASSAGAFASTRWRGRTCSRGR